MSLHDPGLGLEDHFVPILLLTVVGDVVISALVIGAAYCISLDPKTSFPLILEPQICILICQLFLLILMVIDFIHEFVYLLSHVVDSLTKFVHPIHSLLLMLDQLL